MHVDKCVIVSASTMNGWEARLMRTEALTEGGHG